MKLTPVDHIPSNAGGKSLFEELFPRKERRPLVANPGRAWRVDGLLFSARDTETLRVGGRKQGFRLSSHLPLTSEQEEWPIFRDKKPDSKHKPRVVYISYEPALLEKETQRRKRRRHTNDNH